MRRRCLPPPALKPAAASEVLPLDHGPRATTTPWLNAQRRLQARELTTQSQEFSDFEREMNESAMAMSPAAKQLEQLKWADAIQNEQKALQHLLRAEATFRQIQVAFGARLATRSSHC